VTTTTNFITDTVRQIGGDRVEVSGLMGPGVDPHLYKASASDVGKLREADVIVYGGLQLEGKMADLLEQLEERQTTLAITKDIPRDKLLLPPDDVAEQYDPHVWFDVTNWMVAARTTPRSSRRRIPPAPRPTTPTSSGTCRARGDRRVRHARSGDPRGARDAGDLPRRFEYFGRRYGMEVAAIQGISTAAEATTSDVRAWPSSSSTAVSRRCSSSPACRDRRSTPSSPRPRGRAAARCIGGELFTRSPPEPRELPAGTYVGMVRANADRIGRGTEIAPDSTGGPAPLELRRLTVSYGARPVVWDVDARFPAGALSAVVGPNGAGKSTLLKAALGLIPPTPGQALIDGRPVRGALDRVAYVPQRDAIDWDFPITVREVVEMGRYAGRDGSAAWPRTDRALVEDCLERVGHGRLPQRARSGACRAGSASACSSPARWPSRPRSCSWTSRSPGVDARTESSILELWAAPRRGPLDHRRPPRPRDGRAAFDFACCSTSARSPRARRRGPDARDAAPRLRRGAAGADPARRRVGWLIDLLPDQLLRRGRGDRARRCSGSPRARSGSSRCCASAASSATRSRIRRCPACAWRSS
jgi:manganese/zinc/iron transport system substrate-binding protein